MSDFFSDYSVVFGTIMTVYAHLFLPLSLKDCEFRWNIALQVVSGNTL